MPWAQMLVKAKLGRVHKWICYVCNAWGIQKGMGTSIATQKTAQPPAK